MERRSGLPLPREIEEALEIFGGRRERTEDAVEAAGTEAIGAGEIGSRLGGIVEGTIDDLNRPRHLQVSATAETPRERGTRRGRLFDLLRTRAALRDAIIVSEVLGPPKALRDESTGSR